MTVNGFCDRYFDRYFTEFRSFWGQLRQSG